MYTPASQLRSGGGWRYGRQRPGPRYPHCCRWPTAPAFGNLDNYSGSLLDPTPWRHRVELAAAF